MFVLIPLLITVHVIVSLLLIGIVLMQRPRSEGLGAAFGGGMTENVFGAQTTDFLGKATVWLGSLFFIVSLVLAMLFARWGTGETAVQKELLSQPVPAATAPAESSASPAAEPSSTHLEKSVSTSEATQSEHTHQAVGSEQATTENNVVAPADQPTEGSPSIDTSTQPSSTVESTTNPKSEEGAKASDTSTTHP